MDHPLRLADQLRAHLRALRKQRGLTQAQLGQRVGIGQVRVAEIEARPGLVSTDQLIQLLAALGATLVLRDSSASADAPVQPTKAVPKRGVAKAAPKRGVAKAAPKRGVAKAAGRNKPSTPAAPPPPSKKGSW